MKRLLINLVTILCCLMAALVAMLYLLPSSQGVSCFWSASNTRYDITVERGLVLVCQLHQYEFETPLRCWLYEAETPRGFAWFKKTSGWWHGSNSWWERTGYTVIQRKRLLSFEYASGKFWPPFVWQHPEVPFTAYSFPLWSIVFFFMLLPLVRGCRKLVAFYRSRASMPSTD